MHQHKNVLTRKGSTVKDMKRSTWVTSVNFESMFENIYEMMVEAGIAEKKRKRFNVKQGTLHILYAPHQNTYSL
jgi:hypothetical protein